MYLDNIAKHTGKLMGTFEIDPELAGQFKYGEDALLIVHVRVGLPSPRETRGGDIELVQPFKLKDARAVEGDLKRQLLAQMGVHEQLQFDGTDVEEDDSDGSSTATSVETSFESATPSATSVDESVRVETPVQAPDSGAFQTDGKPPLRVESYAAAADDGGWITAGEPEPRPVQRDSRPKRDVFASFLNRDVD